MYVDSLSLISHHVGFGELGLHGGLGWDGQSVVVGGALYPHALSAHAPSSIVIDLQGQYDYFTCSVALNDTATEESPLADFYVRADGRTVASVFDVGVGRVHRIVAGVHGAQRLELRVEPGRYSYCHSVWLDPQVFWWTDAGLLDCTGQVRVYPPREPIVADRCFVTQVSPGYERWLDIFLTSLARNGGCPDAPVIVYAVDPDTRCSDVIRRHNAYEIRCEGLSGTGANRKPAIFSVGYTASVRRVVTVEADMVVLDDLSGLFDALDVLPERNVLVAQEMHWTRPVPLDSFLAPLFGGTDEELDRIFKATPEERRYDLQINGGVIAGNVEALTSLDNTIRDFGPAVVEWMHARPNFPARDLFITNFALARWNTGARLNQAYNYQLEFRTADIRHEKGKITAHDGKQFVKCLHFNGPNKGVYPAVQSYYWEYGNPDNKLIDGLRRLQAAPLELLRSVEFVSELIRSIGLQRPPLHDPAQVYGADAEYVNEGAGLYQVPEQLAAALVYLSDKDVRSYAEIGIYHGWTFSFVTAYLNRFRKLERSVGVDTCDHFSAYYRVRDLLDVEFIQATAEALRGQEFDLVLIDAHHTYEAGLSDYENVGGHNRICMFHDVADALISDYAPGPSVRDLWAELKAAHPGGWVEFTGHPTHEDRMGIGILFPQGDRVCTDRPADGA